MSLFSDEKSREESLKTFQRSVNRKIGLTNNKDAGHAVVIIKFRFLIEKLCIRIEI